MTIPAAIRQQAEEADRLIKELSGETTEEHAQQEASEVAEVEEPEAAETPAEEANEITDLSENQHEDISRQEIEENQEPEPEAQPEIEPETPINQASELEEWKAKAEKAEARYKTLQGKYNKEIKALSSELQPNVDDSEIVSLKNEIEVLKKQLSDKTEEKRKKKADPAVEARLRQNYGDDLVDDLVELMTAELAPDLSNVEAELQKVADSQRAAGSDTFATKRMVLSKSLQEKGIDWASVDSDPLFHDWLSKYDQETGVQRNSQLLATFNNGEIDKTAALYEQFAEESGLLTKNTAKMQPKVDFKAQVKPQTKAPREPMTAEDAATVWTPEAIYQFYEKKRRGEYTPEKAAQLEREIFAAQ
ncbi:hypothetical protein [Photobacterium damselae]|uniref:hypothetical protein n=1 Tax=Photobacterium damselae TaxID=38293 RepID=UPI001F239DF3|nr:hypothetical protein [Photobacterium damselae]UKA12927.1 hypothetical protein IHC91_21655 [Photobacterium damselae subsp. damselae]